MIHEAFRGKQALKRDLGTGDEFANTETAKPPYLPTRLFYLLTLNDVLYILPFILDRSWRQEREEEGI